jgi:hypothetical protein
VVRASTDGAGIPEGTKVKVTTEVKVYHAPKRAEGIDLQGMEGTIAKNTIYYKGKELSPNLPYKVQFELDPGAKAKFFAHLVSNSGVGWVRGAGVQQCDAAGGQGVSSILVMEPHYTYGIACMHAAGASPAAANVLLDSI